MRIVQISDTHVLAGDGVTARNTARVIEYVNEVLRPDLVVHTGDVVGLSPDDVEDRRAAAASLAELRAPCLFVPGNHDVGSAAAEPWMGFGVTPARLAAHAAEFGEVPLMVSVGEWDLIGVNSQLFDSDLAEEQAQWEWLERALSGSLSRPAIVLLHRPVRPVRPHRQPDANSLSSGSCARMLALPGIERVQAFGSGHLHWFRSRRRDRCLEVWAPAVGLRGTVPDDLDVAVQCGVVEWRLEGSQLAVAFRAPSGLEQFEFPELDEIRTRIDELQRSGNA